MPIEIKEISIKADIYPDRRQETAVSTGLTAQELEKLKKELSREVYEAVIRKIKQTNER